MTCLARFTYDSDIEQWWIDPDNDRAAHEPHSSIFVVPVDPADLAMLAYHYQAFLDARDRLVGQAGLDPHNPATLTACTTFTLPEYLTTNLGGDRWAESHAHAVRNAGCATCGHRREGHTP